MEGLPSGLPGEDADQRSYVLLGHILAVGRIAAGVGEDARAISTGRS